MAETMCMQEQRQTEPTAWFWVYGLPDILCWEGGERQSQLLHMRTE